MRTYLNNPRGSLAAIPLAAILGLAGVAPALAVSSSAAGSAKTAQATQTATQQQHLADIKSKGDAEINRRLTQLGSLTALINSATRLTASDKSSLSAQVSGEVSGLTTLESTLNGETTLAGAITDAQDIYTEYRVYALITPKVHLIKVADDQQVTEANLANLATKLQTRITADQTAGKSVTALQSQLADMNIQISNAQKISSSMEANVIGLQPSDYDSNHTVLSGDATQLKTAHSENEAAYNDAKMIVSGLESLK